MKSVNLLPPENSSDEFIEELSPQNPYKKALIFMGIIILILACVLFWSLYKLHLASKEKPQLIVTETTKVPIAPIPEKVKPAEQPKPIEQPAPVAPEIIPQEPPVKPPEVKLVKPKVIESPKVETPKVEVKKIEPVKEQPAPEENKVQPLEKREYSLLLGTFNAAETKKKVEEIKKLGLTPQQKKVKLNQKGYLVYVERVSSYELAQNLEKQLKKDGFDTYLSSDKKSTDGFRVRTGVFVDRGNAKDLLNQLKSKGYNAQIETSQLNIAKYEVKIGTFPSYQAAKAQQNALQSKKIKTILLMKQVE